MAGDGPVHLFDGLVDLLLDLLLLQYGRIVVQSSVPPTQKETDEKCTQRYALGPYKPGIFKNGFQTGCNRPHPYVDRCQTFRFFIQSG